ncbi:MAG: hypothetical protein WCL34_14250 [Methylococcaceae bacterium]
MDNITKFPPLHILPKKNTPTNPTEKPAFPLKNYLVNDSLAEMEAQMLRDVFVLDGIALLGQLTAIYAKPNAGKTLTTIYMLIESIKAGRIKGEDIFYINADDSGNGLTAKVRIAVQYGFGMVAPSYEGFESDHLVKHLKQGIAEDTARGQIVVLDTLKKFTDLMHKTKGSDFMKVAREFTLKGGTMIMLAHANKNRGADGKIVAGGTSDIGDDADCVYLLDEVSKTETTKTVLFDNAKKRGNNVQELSFSYAMSSKNYGELLESVQMLDFETTEKTKKDFIVNSQREKDVVVIEAIIDGISQGEHKVADLRKFAMNKDNYGISRRKFDDVLDRYTGEKLSNSSLWRVQVGERNSKIYYLLSVDNTTANEYENAKNG